MPVWPERNECRKKSHGKKVTGKKVTGNKVTVYIFNETYQIANVKKMFNYLFFYSVSYHLIFI